MYFPAKKIKMKYLAKVLSVQKNCEEWVLFCSETFKFGRTTVKQCGKNYYLYLKYKFRGWIQNYQTTV